MRFSFFLTALLVTASAHAGFGFGVKGLLGYDILRDSSSSTSSSSLSGTHYSYGGGIGFDVGGSFGVMLDALYVRRGWGYLTTKYELNFINVPLQLRAIYKDAVISVGGYYAQSFGNVTSSSGGSFTPSMAGISPTDYGMVFGLGFRGGKGVKLTAETRFQVGLKNLNSAASTSSNFWTVDLLLGFMI